MKLRILIAGLVFGLTAALAAESGAEMFQKAVTQERAAGNLEEAIKLYQRVAKEFASDRALAAKALVQEARCYEKLGQDKAVKLYEQVARDFGDQRELAAAATARLAVLRQGDRAAAVPATMTQRKIELPSPGSSLYSSINHTDGQRAVYKDDATGALMISDLTGRNKRVIFKPKEGEELVSIGPSRDLSITEWGLRKPDGSETHGMIRADSTGYREIVGGGFSCPPDFSWDNSYLLECEFQPDHTTRLLTISVSGGQIREFRRTIEGTIITHASFSPDGHFIAYSTNRREVSVLPVEGGEPRLVCNTATLLDWTRDGRFLVIADDRSGSTAIDLFPIKDGRQVGDTVFLRYGSFEWGRTTTSGALVYRSTPPGGRLIQSLASLDPDGHLGAWKRSTASSDSSDSSQYVGMIMWSPDGSQIAYVAVNRAAGQNASVVHVHNMTSGEDRELYRSSRLLYCAWAAQRPNLFCDAATQHGSEVISVAVDTGRAERIASLPGPRFVLAASRDDRALYMFSSAPKWGLVRWEIDTHQETTLEEFSNPGVPNVVPSPDDRWLLRRAKQDLEIRPMSGGAWKRLVSVNVDVHGPPSNVATFTPDNQWLLYRDKDSSGREGLFRVSTAGGNPERIGDFPGGASTTYQTFPAIHVSADGRNFIVVSPDSNNLPELWLLENFEPKAPAAR